MSDPYARAADHLDLLLAGAWTALREPLAEALAPVVNRDGLVVELGAGTGTSTAVIAETLPSARLHIVEPSDHLRAVLMHRVANDPDLRTRTTVEHRPYPEAGLPEPFDALVMMNSLGHLAPDERTRLWADIAQGMTPGGAAAVNLQAPFSAVVIDEFDMGSVRIGTRDYHGTAWAEPLSDTEVRWHMTYLISNNNTEIDCRVTTYDWQIVTPTRLSDELAAHDLTAQAVGDADTGMFRLVRV